MKPPCSSIPGACFRPATADRRDSGDDLRIYMNTKYKTILMLVLLSVIDAVIPLPILGVLLIYVVIKRPPAFMDLANKIYSGR